MERVIDCPVCYDTDNCFEDVQENYSSYLCFHCGFMSDSRYEISSLQLVENLKKSPHDKRLDVENAKEYSQYEFLKACKEMGITRDLKQNA